MIDAGLIQVMQPGAGIKLLAEDHQVAGVSYSDASLHVVNTVTINLSVATKLLIIWRAIWNANNVNTGVQNLIYDGSTPILPLHGGVPISFSEEWYQHQTVFPENDCSWGIVTLAAGLHTLTFQVAAATATSLTDISESQLAVFSL